MHFWAVSGGGPEQRGGFSVNFAALAWASATKSAHAKDAHDPMEPNDWQASLIKHGLNLPALRELEFQLQDGDSVVVVGLDPELMHRPFKLGGHQILRTADREWTSWAKLPFGRMPQREDGGHDWMKDAILDLAPDSTIQQMVADRNLNSGPMELHCYLQDFAKYAGDMVDDLRKMDSDDVRAIERLVAGLAKLAKANTSGDVLAVSIPLEEANGLITSDAAVQASKRICLGHDDCKFPLTAIERDRLWFAPHVLFAFSMALFNFFRDENGQSIADKAGAEFEHFIAKILGESGYTGPAGSPVVGYAFSKKSGDVDVFAWNDDEVLLVECKYEMQPPGAWSTKNMEKRQGDLEKRLAKLRSRREACLNSFASGTPRLSKENTEDLVLPADLLDSRKLRTILVSARFEPTFDAGDDEVVTIVGSHFEEPVREHMPLDQFHSVWYAPGPLP